jgi:hypothetical protein
MHEDYHDKMRPNDKNYPHKLGEKIQPIMWIRWKKIIVTDFRRF